MKSDKLISQITKELMARRDLEYKNGSINFFKEPINPIGVRAADTRKISAKYFAQIKTLSKKEIFDLCEEFLKTGYMEHGTIAFSWAYRLKKDYSIDDFEIFEKWLKRYVRNWAHCDDFCTHAFGVLLFRFPQLLKKTKKWTKSKNRWMRRAAAVTLIYAIKSSGKIIDSSSLCKGRSGGFLIFNEKITNEKPPQSPFRKGEVLEKCFWVADKLLLDKDDLVQKGYGWMLKVAADVWQKEVFDYVMKNKSKMSRTALRYAIEKMPRKLKKVTMQTN